MSLFGRDKPREVATLGDLGVMLDRDRGQSTLSRMRSDNFEENAVKNKITNDVKETIFFFETLTYAGINNTSSKLFGNWFNMDSPIEGETMDKTMRHDLIHFHESIHLKPKMMETANDSMAYGNGYLELVGERGVQNPAEPLYPEDGLKDVARLDPLYIAEKIEPINDEEFYYIHRQKNGGTFKLHNSRVVHIPWATLGTMMFGRGVIEIGIRTMLAKIGMDWALGEVLYRFGKPFLVLKTQNATKKELKKAHEIIKRLNPRTSFAGTDRHTFEMLNPGVIDPEPFAKFYYINQARALEMPYMVFIGSQKGSVTGSEVDLSDWYQTLKSKQEAKFTGPINTINNFFLHGNWIDRIYWNDIYVNQKMEWEINLSKAKTLDVLYRQDGIMIDMEARQWCRDQGIPFPENDKEFSFEQDEPPEFDITEIPYPFTEDNTKYNCECIKCGYTLQSDEHCRDIKCPKCGGEMRRKTRPGHGNEEDARKQQLIDKLKDDEFHADQIKFWRERNGKK